MFFDHDIGDFGECFGAAALSNPPAAFDLDRDDGCRSVECGCGLPSPRYKLTRHIGRLAASEVADLAILNNEVGRRELVEIAQDQRV